MVQPPAQYEDRRMEMGDDPGQPVGPPVHAAAPPMQPMATPTDGLGALLQLLTPLVQAQQARTPAPAPV